MKRFCLTLLVLVSAVSLANAQIIRSSGVVKKTRVSVEREKTEKVKTNETYSWQNEVGRITHSAGVVLGSDFDMLMLMADYNAQYRFSPLFSAGVGAWVGMWGGYDDEFGLNLRANVKFHPLATLRPESKYQPYIALWGDVIIPNADYTWAGTDPIAMTAEIGCDIYGNHRPLFVAFSLNIRNDWGNEYMFWEESVYSPCLKVGMKF